MNKIKEAVKKLETYIETEKYRGYDPYDGLTSPLFKLPVLKSNKIVRLYFQQLIKRFPINLRPLLFIKKGYNPVTIGLCIQGYTYQLQINHHLDTLRNELINKIELLIDELIKIQSKGYSGACWGYDFDWQSSSVTIPAYGPTVVATGIITNALFEYHKVTGNEKAKELILSSANFVVNDLNRTISDNGFCFSYSPFDSEAVYNANMKAVRLLSQAYSISKNRKLLEIEGNALRFVLNFQNPDGSWFYSNRTNNNRIDSYHTGYVLDCIKSYMELTEDMAPKEQLKNGYNFFKYNFISNNGEPKFYNNNTYPIDMTSAAQIIFTLCNFGDVDLAMKTANYVIKNIQSDSGYFYFRKYNRFTNRTSFMRWSNAWMFAALARLYFLKG